MNGKNEVLSSIKLNLIEQKKFEEAINEITKLIKKNPNNGEAYKLLGRVYLNIKNYDLALDNIIKAIIIDPNISGVNIYLLGIGWRYTEKYGLKKIDKYIEIMPDNSALYKIRARYYEIRKQYKKALNEYSIALKVDPKNSQLYYHRAKIFQQIGEYDAAIDDFDEALKIDPLELSVVLIDKAILFLRNIKFSEAFNSLAQYIEIASERTKDHFGDTIHLYFDNEIDKAIEICDCRLADAQKDWCAISCRGILNLIKQNFDYSVSDFTEALSITSSNPYIFFCRGFALLLMELPKIAAEDAKTAYSLDPGNDHFGSFYKKLPDFHYS